MRVACRLYTAALLFTTFGQRPTSFATATKQPCAVLTSNYSKCLHFWFIRCHGHADVPASEPEHLTDGNQKERPLFSESFRISGQQTVVHLQVISAAVTSRISATILPYQLRYNTKRRLIRTANVLSQSTHQQLGL